MIGIIAGDGSLPKLIVKRFNNKKFNHVVINLSKKKNKKQKYIFAITQISSIIQILKKNKCKEVILAGKVTRPNFTDFRFDKKIIKFLPKILNALKKGDSYLLDLVIDILKKEKMKVVSCTKYLPELFANNIKNKKLISSQDLKDIKKGKNLLENLNQKFDVGQSAIINNGFVVAIEAAEGTDQMLLKSTKILKKLNKNNQSGILIKLPKKIQDLRIDLPTIGFKTVKKCIDLRLNGIVLKKNAHIFLDQEKSIALIKKNNFFIKIIN